MVPNIVEPIIVHYDNKGVIAKPEESRSHHKAKHILRRYYLIREMVRRSDVRMDRIASAENMTCPWSKPISQIGHTQHLEKMGLKYMGDWLKGQVGDFYCMPQESQ
ncbi:UNVERIFIED_CONTAM: hypothetical protein Sradi_2993700 [Sesamum radiatum]|uniref:Uncharacterized protein n=1 Tax=Sesamum radiatum TaxID=300843 RepID=A0AAW2S0P8_SESRA